MPQSFQKIVLFQVKLSCMRSLTTFFIFVLGSFLTARGQSILQGHIYIEQFAAESVYVENVSQLTNTLSDSTGYFSISTKMGDTLLFTDKSVVPQRLIVTAKTQNENNVVVRLKDIANELPETLVYANAKINAVDLGIIAKEIKPLTNNEKKLHTAGDFKLIHLLGLLGGQLKIDPIINKISGKTKRLKKTISAERTANTYALLRENYSDFISDNFSIAEEETGRFMYFLADNAVINPLLEKGEQEPLKFFISQEWVKFQEMEKNK